MTRNRTPRRHLVRGIVGGLMLGIGAALVMWLFGVATPSADVVVVAALALGTVLGALRLPRSRT